MKKVGNFFERVYALVREIPRGKVVTYGQIAKVLGAPRWSQVVGFALHQNPDPKNIPCHRVVNRFGGLSESFAFGGKSAQREKLEAEGIEFGADGTIDLARFGWRPELSDVL